MTARYEDCAYVEFLCAGDRVTSYMRFSSYHLGLRLLAKSLV